MRAVRYSRTFAIALDSMLAQGELRISLRGRVVREKRALVRATIEQHLAPFPRSKRPHPQLGLIGYPVADTPFVVLYDFDGIELRVHFIFHKNASLDNIDPLSAARCPSFRSFPARRLVSRQPRGDVGDGAMGSGAFFGEGLVLPLDLLAGSVVGRGLR